MLRDVTAIGFSFKNILKISNLQGLDSLTKLQLDNNVIDKIVNLGHLVRVNLFAFFFILLLSAIVHFSTNNKFLHLLTLTTYTLNIWRL